MKAQEIIDLANDIKMTWKTKNPFEIAERLGILVMLRDSKVKDFTAQTIQTEGYPTIVSINKRYSDTGKSVLCAHELGHALLHTGTNHFKVTENNMRTNVEYEANLFAVALLFEQSELSMSMEKMANSTLRALLDYNLE